MPKVQALPDEALTTKRLRKYAAAYREISAQIASLEKQKATLKTDCLAILGRMADAAGQSEESFSLGFRQADGRVLKPQRYQIVRTTWDIKALAAALRRRGLDKRVLKVVVDEAALRAALEKGLIGLDEVQPHGEAEVTFGFRVDLLKAEEEGAD